MDFHAPTYASTPKNSSSRSSFQHDSPASVADMSEIFAEDTFAEASATSAHSGELQPSASKTGPEHVFPHTSTAFHNDSSSDVNESFDRSRSVLGSPQSAAAPKRTGRSEQSLRELALRRTMTREVKRAGRTRKRSPESRKTAGGGWAEKDVVSDSDDDVQLLTDDDSEKENALISDDQQQSVCTSFDAAAQRSTRPSDSTDAKGVQFLTPRRTRAVIESSSEEDEEGNQEFAFSRRRTSTSRTGSAHRTHGHRFVLTSEDEDGDESAAQCGGWDADDGPEETTPVTIEESDDSAQEEKTPVTIEESDDDVQVVAMSQEFVGEIEQSPDAVDREKPTKKAKSPPASGGPKRPNSYSPEVFEVIAGNTSASNDNEVQIIRSKPVARPKLSAKAHADLEVRLANARRLLTQFNDGKRLPDGGAKIRERIQQLEVQLADSASTEGTKLGEGDDSRSDGSDDDVASPERSNIGSSASAVADRRQPGPIRKPAIIDAPKLTRQDYNRFITAKPPKRLLGGRVNEKRRAEVESITDDVLTGLCSSLKSHAENESTETPPSLNVELKPHQKQCLSWMLFRERQKPSGGILADDMGLGKTISMLALIAHQKEARDEAEHALKRKAALQDADVYSEGTLVIAPASVISQWAKEVEDKVRASALTVYVFHGQKNKRDNNPRRLAEFDVVITTYDLVKNELSEKKQLNAVSAGSESDTDSDGGAKKAGGEKRVISKKSSSVLARIIWERIILDEAHIIKNRNSLASKACCRLMAFNRWCLSGTPIHNELWDLYSLIRFLRVHPFDDKTHWKEYIMSNSKNASQRLNTLVKSLLLRRTKDQKDALTGKPIVSGLEEVKVVMEGVEAEVYQKMKEAVRLRVKTLLEDDYEDAGLSLRRKKKNPTDELRNPFKTGARAITGDNFESMSCILVLLLRLRQAAVHMSLTAQDIDMDAFRNEGDFEAEALEKSLANLSLHGNLRDLIEESGDVTDEARMQQIQAVFQSGYLSAKVRAMLERLDDIIKKGEKCVIVSQWSTMLNVVESQLRQRCIRLTSITGKIPTKDRQERVDSFNKQGRGAQVMLLSLAAGGVGLNLVGGNHLFLVDLHWNPALEQQACDRVYRMGQTRDVFIYKFVCESTIEQKVLELQDKKKQLASDVLDGATQSKKNKLTVNDLKFLFELDPPATRTIRAKASSSHDKQQPPAQRAVHPAPQLPRAIGGIITLD